MGCRRFTLVSMLISALISALVAGGCQSGRPMTVAEYRPAQPPVERKAPASEVFQLVRWQPVAPASSTAATRAASASIRQVPVELQRRYLDRGQPLGFARNGPQLLAIAGDTATPLDDAHYEWKTAPAEPVTHMDFNLHALGDVTLVVGAVAIIGGLIFWYFHDNRHRLDQAFDFD